MRSLQKIFQYQGKQVRTIIRDGQPWWVAKDIAEILEYANPSKMYARVDEYEKTTIPFREDGSNYQTNIVIINESGLYEAIMGSEKPEAKDFKRWIKTEVLPSIRRTGSYSIQPQFQIPQTYPDALRLAADLAEENQRLKPKAEMHDLFLSADNNQPMAAVAKSLGVGRNKLFAFLRNRKILRNNNEPYQAYMDRGYFVVIEKPIIKGTRVENITQTFVTPKGVDYIAKLLNREEAV